MEYKKKEEIIKRFYAKGLPILASFEPERKRRLRHVLIIELILVIISAIYFCNFVSIISFLDSKLSACSLAVILVCLSQIFIYPFSANCKFKKDLKTKVIPKVMKTFEIMEHTDSKNIFSEKELLESTLFSEFNCIEPDDSFSGTVDGVYCKISETELFLKASRGYTKSFKGVIVSFDSNKKINAKTTITTANDTEVRNSISIEKRLILFFAVAGMFVPLFQSLDIIQKDPSVLLMFSPLILLLILVAWFFIDNKKNFKDVYNQNNTEIFLEDPKFAKRFKVFSEDEVEARYLITTSFMERFLNLTTSFGSNKVKCAFYNDKVMFAISTCKNLFEFGNLYKPLDNPKNIGFFNEIFSILDMIDYFKFDEKTGL